MKTILLYKLLFGFVWTGLYLHRQEFGIFIRNTLLNKESIIQIDNTDTIYPLDIAMEYIHAHQDDWGLTPQDLVGMTVNAMYTDRSSGITRIYFLQHHQGIPVHNAVLNVSIAPEGRVFFTGNRFISDLAHKINTTTPTLSAHAAVMTLASHLALPKEEVLMKKQDGPAQFVFEQGTIASEDITAKLSYQRDGEKVVLAWNILLAPVGSLDKWDSHVDARTGAILTKDNWAVYCNGDRGSSHGEHVSRPNQTTLRSEDLLADRMDTVLTDGSQPNAFMSDAQYNVWPAPIENPNQGPRLLVSNPSDPIASPYGWHDIDGLPGPEYTITRGNNTYVFQDRNNDGYSSQDEPDGSPELHFDFPFHALWEPKQYTDAAAVNLFYGINFMHDFAYRFGFDEAAGNFQINTYGNGGIGNDFIYGIVQAGAEEGFRNEAAYLHNLDGQPGVIFSMEYDRLPQFLTVNEPVALAGQYTTSTLDPGWGPGAYITDTPITGEVVIVDDGVAEASTTDACEEILNASELAGKIAFIDRGACSMPLKALHAQAAGAIGVVICNSNKEYFRTLAPGEFGAQVQIPVVHINASEGQILRQYAGKGLKVTLVDPGQRIPAAYDISLDNGVIAHEYGHGITWRLVGGPNLVCMENAENMDEGWSDFFALVTTVRSGDEYSSRTRGIATYLTEEPSASQGRRRYPYSTDMQINPLTYGDVAASHKPHDVGETWASILWDIYWALVDEYGWKADTYDASSGNYKAIRLVFDGLKNLACNPGYVDARDAILAADEALFSGENRCLLWEVFARRGLGFSAEQGSPFYLGDEKEAFDKPPLCAQQIRIEKSVTDFILPGEEINVTITVGNFKQDVITNVVVTDQIPAGTVFKQNSSTLPASIQGETISFSLGEMQFAEERTITYTLETSPDAWSHRQSIDEVSDTSNSRWRVYSITYDGPNHWMITDEYPVHSGNYAWYIEEISGTSRQVLELNPNEHAYHVEGDHPVLRFYHQYFTHCGINGGLVEIREVGTSAWSPVGEDILRNGYPGFVDYLTFTAPDIHAFSGNSGEEYQATYVDLSKWTGKDIQIRFRFGTVPGSESHIGWLIDDIEFMDMLSYNGEVCVTCDQGDYECTISPEAGTIVESKAEIVSATEQLSTLSVKIFPNPASDRVTVALSGEEELDIHVGFMSMDGRLLLSKTLGRGNYHMSTEQLPAGMYLVKVCTAEGQMIEKVIIQK